MSEAVETLRSVRAAWDAATRDGDAACGTDVVAAAYRELHRAWSTELDAYIELLERADRGQ